MLRVSFSLGAAPLVLVSLLLLLLAAPHDASASLIGLNPDSPDLTSQPDQISFNSGTGEFKIKGSVIGGFDIDHVAPPDYGMGDFGGTVNYEINLILDNTGTPLSGTLLVEGTLPALGANSGTLLTGVISDFGFQTTGPFVASVFEFLFQVTGGDLHPTYFPQLAGVVLTAVDPLTTYNGSFNADFSFVGSISQTDTFAQAPEPAAAVLLLAGVPVLVRRLRKRR